MTASIRRAKMKEKQKRQIITASLKSITSNAIGIKIINVTLFSLKFKI
jgi:hypothetical protein